MNGAIAAWGIAGGDPEVTMRINAAVWRFWLARGAAGEARDVLRTALASGRGDPELRSKALNAAGVMAGATSDFATARALFEEALVLGRQLDDPQRVARPLMNLGLIAVYTQIRIFEKMKRISVAPGGFRESVIHGTDGQIAQPQGSISQARKQQRLMLLVGIEVHRIVRSERC